MEQLIISFIDTLNLLLLPAKEFGTPYLSTIQLQLEELEGDYHTFFYEKNLIKLHDEGYFSFEVINKIKKIKNRIDSFDESIWNPKDFVDNDKWKAIRKDIIEILKEEMIK